MSLRHGGCTPVDHDPNKLLIASPCEIIAGGTKTIGTPRYVLNVPPIPAVEPLDGDFLVDDPGTPFLFEEGELIRFL